jgi:hypothetical protein
VRAGYAWSRTAPVIISLTSAVLIVRSPGPAAGIGYRK